MIFYISKIWMQFRVGAIPRLPALKALRLISEIANQVIYGFLQTYFFKNVSSSISHKETPAFRDYGLRHFSFFFVAYSFINRF